MSGWRRCGFGRRWGWCRVGRQSSRRADITNAKVAESYRSDRGNRTIRWTRAHGSTWLVGVAARDHSIEPGDIPRPGREDKDETASKSLAHGSKTALGSVIVHRAEDLLRLGAKAVRERVATGTEAWPIGIGMLNLLAVLDKEALDLDKFSVGRVVIRDELSHDCVRLGRVKRERRSRAVERLVVHCIRVDATAVAVARAFVVEIAIAAVFRRRAEVKAWLVARMRGERSTVAVSFEDVQLGTARANVGVQVGTAVDERSAFTALRIAVTSAVGGAGSVGSRSTTRLVHFNKVDASVGVATHLGQVNVERELLVEELEDLVVAVVFQQVQALVQFKAERLAIGSHAIRLVVHTFVGAVLGARLSIGADTLDPVAAVVTAAVVVADLVEPAPVGIEHDLGVLRRASASLGARLSLKDGMDFSLGGADLLGT